MTDIAVDLRRMRSRRDAHSSENTNCDRPKFPSDAAGFAVDEKLVLYGRLEDRDFAATVARRGSRQIKTEAAVGGRVLGFFDLVRGIFEPERAEQLVWRK